MKITRHALTADPESVENLPSFILSVDNYPDVDLEALALAEGLGFEQIGDPAFVGVNNELAEYKFVRTEPVPPTLLSDLTFGDSFTIGDDLVTVWTYQAGPGRFRNYIYLNAQTYVETDVNLEVTKLVF